MVRGQQIDLDKIRVQLATTAWDVDDIKETLSNYHPLGCNRAKGRRMYYMATYNGYWVAVLVFDAVVRANKMREGEIGWSVTQRDTRLQHVANNSRFLVSRAFQGTPNVASKVLALTAERISKDWMRRYGVALLALETYVDPQHNGNEGTCYTAAGWSKLGLSSGYQAYGKERTHGKWYFLKELHRQSYEALRSPIPHALMTGVREVSGTSNNNFVLDASKFDIKSLQRALSVVEDPRTKHGIRYKFLPLLSMCVAAAVSGHTQYRQIADWIRSIPAPERASFGLRGDSTPNETTIGNLLRTINPEQLNKALTGWLQETYPHQANGNQRIILDGKALRATASKASDQVGFLNVFAAELGIVIEQLPCLKGGGEKLAAQQFVDSCTEAELKGKVFLADAIHTDSQLVSRLQKKKAFYLLPVKDNNRELVQQIQRYMDGARERQPELVYSHETLDKGHGRIDQRAISVVAAHNTQFNIAGIQQVGEIVRTRFDLRTGGSTSEKVLVITNIPFADADAAKLLMLNRSYWAIENKLHYRKDMVFSEDRSTIRAKHGPKNMAALRNFALGLLLSNGVENVKRCVDNLRHYPHSLLKLAA